MKKIIFFSVQMACIMAIALITDFKTPDLLDVNWDGAIFLTPLGIIKNYSFSPVMRSFYADTSPGQMHLGPLQYAGLFFLLNVEIFCFSKILQKKKS